MPDLKPMPRFQFTSGCQIIAEIAQAHDGSLGAAHALIDAAARAGAHAVKFQIHLADSESTREEQWRVPFSRQDASRFDYWRRMEFTAEQWTGLSQHAREAGLAFVVSPFSTEAVALGSRIGVDVWKVASGELGHTRLLEAIFAQPEPVIISTGMSDWAEIERVVGLAAARQKTYALLQCDTRYPSPPESWGLNVVGELQRRFECPVGLSDHSGDIYAGLAAAALGANLVEAHITLSKAAFGPDVPASLTPEQFAALAEGVRQIELARSHPVDKDVNAHRLADVRAIFSRSVALLRDLPAGSTLGLEHLTLKKPAGGFSETDLPHLIGRTLAVDLTADVLLRESHLIPL